MTAAKNRDIAFFERHVGKDYVQVTDGKRVDFAAQLAGLKSGLMRIETAALRDMRVHVVGDAAIVSLSGTATEPTRACPSPAGRRASTSS